METFGVGHGAASMTESIQMGVAFCVGPIAADLVNKLGCRTITIVGSALAATGMLLSGMATNIAMLYLTAGFCTGKCAVILIS